jgi:uncharacterized membrane protein (UPF0127 family)
MKIVLVENQSRPLDNPLHAGYCSSFVCRLRGLTFRSQLASDEGLLLVQNRDSKLDSAIHMMFVFTDLAVAWINSNFEVVDVQLARSWHLAYVSVQPARYVLEMAPERLSDFKIGDQVRFV